MAKVIKKFIKAGCLILLLAFMTSSCLEADKSTEADSMTDAPDAATTGPLPTNTPMAIQTTPTPVATATQTPATTATPTIAPQATSTSGETAGANAAFVSDLPFSPKELSGSLYHISLGMDVNEVAQAFGPPQTSQSLAYYHGYNIVYYYEYCEIGFTPRYHAYRDSDGAYVVELTQEHDVYAITVTDPEYQGPRGVQIGDSARQVLEKLCYPVEVLDQKVSGVVYEDDEIIVSVHFTAGEISQILVDFDDSAKDFAILFVNSKVQGMMLENRLD